MEKIMVIVFEDETKAYEGIKKLKQLDADGSITIHQSVLARKNKDGTLQTDDKSLLDFPVQTLAGTGLGALIGLLGGLPGVLIGAATGATLGVIGDGAVGTLDSDFLKEVNAELKPGAAAVALDLSEEWVTPIDTELTPLSKTISRRMKIDVEDDLLSRRADASDKELAALEKELKQAGADNKVKVQKRIDELKARVKRDVARADDRQKQLKTESQAKVDSLHKKLTAAAKDGKAKIQARLNALEKADQEFSDRMDHAVGEHLKAVADRLGRKTG
jgi:uncharacterized membrane protein